MQDRDSPPQEEGGTNGAAGVVRQDEARVAPWAACARTSREFLLRPWITATAPIWAVITATVTREGDRVGAVFPHPIRCSILSLYPLREKMRRRAYLHLSKTCSS